MLIIILLEQVNTFSEVLIMILSFVKRGGGGGGSVGRAVASDTRDLQFESPHQQNLIYQFHIWIEKTQIKKSRPGMSHI